MAANGCISEGWVREGGEFACDRLWGDGYVEMRSGSVSMKILEREVGVEKD